MKTMSIYVGTYAKYNDGSLFGKWMDLSDYSDKNDFYEACAELHKDEEDPELMFQDWENIPDRFIGESWISEKVWDIINADIQNWDAFEVFMDFYSGNYEEISDLVSKFDDRYQGEWDSEEDFAEQLFDECYAHDIPENLRYYIDYEKFARDLFMGDYYYENGFVFSNY